jgi:hypothetical protein
MRRAIVICIAALALTAISWLAKCPRWRSCVYEHLVSANRRLNFTEMVSAT